MRLIVRNYRKFEISTISLFLNASPNIKKDLNVITNRSKLCVYGNQIMPD